MKPGSRVWHWSPFDSVSRNFSGCSHAWKACPWRPCQGGGRATFSRPATLFIRSAHKTASTTFWGDDMASHRRGDWHRRAVLGGLATAPLAGPAKAVLDHVSFKVPDGAC